MIAKQPNTIDNYISTFPEQTQKLLQKMRATINKVAPAAIESINYGIPTFNLEGNLVHFGGYKNHIGFYPAPSAIKAFAKELSVYKGAKGSVQFPINEPLPLKLIAAIVQFRVKENLQKAAAKKVAKICLQGHKYFKTTDCPTCPICENERKTKDVFLSLLSAPARRALENKGIKTVKQLSTFSEAEILGLHGMGKASLPKLHKALMEEGLAFK